VNTENSAAVQRTIKVDPALWRVFKSKAAANGMKIQDAVREALQKYVRSQRGRP
jgi:predicted DNA binding CopG/RHH family protein